MSTITIEEDQLEEIVSKVLQKHLKSTFQDVDEVRKSPAGAIVRLETKIESLVTRAEFKEEIGNLRTEFKDTYGNLNARLAKVESRLNLLVALFVATFGIFASLLVKLILFP
jgi:5'-deoxynucleotidase YfbR-like HD superfamily hydrolase